MLSADGGPDNANDLQDGANPLIDGYYYVPIFVCSMIIDTGPISLITDEKGFVVTRKGWPLRSGGKNNRRIWFRFLFWRCITAAFFLNIYFHKGNGGAPASVISVIGVQVGRGSKYKSL